MATHYMHPWKVKEVSHTVINAKTYRLDETYKKALSEGEKYKRVADKPEEKEKLPEDKELTFKHAEDKDYPEEESHLLRGEDGADQVPQEEQNLLVSHEAQQEDAGGRQL